MNGSTWPMWAYDRELHGRREYQNIGERWWVEIHGLPDPVVPVTVTEVPLDSPEGTHWGWIEQPGRPGVRDASTPVMIWAHRGTFNIQFPYGPKIEEEHGKGRVVRLRITSDTCPIAVVFGTEPTDCTFRRGHEPPHSWAVPSAALNPSSDAITVIPEEG